MPGSLSSRTPARGSRPHFAGRRTFLPSWSPALANVVGLLVVVFFMGGSSRGDVWSLPILRPIAVLSFFYGLWALSREDVSRHRFLLGLSAATVALIVLHLIPLPPFLWTGLGGREIIVDIDAATGLSGTWRPISMAPEFTWNALFSLAVPLAILTNAIRLTPAEHRIVVIVVLLGGVLSIALGLLQLASGGDPTLYLYRRSNFGMPIGLFANRNHQALFLAMMLPLLAFLLATTRDRRSRLGELTRFLAYAAVLLIITFLIILGSRAGLVAGAIGLVSFVLLSMLASRPEGWHGLPRGQLAVCAAALMTTGVIIAWAMFAGSAESIQRVMDSAGTEELRYTIWPIIADAVPRFIPMGTGVGTYERVFQTFEPDGILRRTYSNHAHNDWLEIALTAGIPGIVLMALAVFAVFAALRRAWYLPAGNARGAAWIGLVIILMAAIGSSVDYPLRVPILSALFSLACVWGSTNISSKGDGPGRMSDTQEWFKGQVYS